jgi:hypothetical protein
MSNGAQCYWIDVVQMPLEYTIWCWNYWWPFLKREGHVSLFLWMFVSASAWWYFGIKNLNAVVFCQLWFFGGILASSVLTNGIVVILSKICGRQFQAQGICFSGSSVQVPEAPRSKADWHHRSRSPGNVSFCHLCYKFVFSPTYNTWLIWFFLSMNFCLCICSESCTIGR